MASYELLVEPDEVVAPALIVSFEDWVDAAGAGSAAARHIAESGDVIASFDPDALYDYRSHRPVLDIIDGTPKEFAWPRMTLTRRRLSERDLFVLTGPEPDYRWHELATDVIALAQKLGVAEWIIRARKTRPQKTAAAEERKAGATPLALGRAA